MVLKPDGVPAEIFWDTIINKCSYTENTPVLWDGDSTLPSVDT
jgi:hypothetical protein